MSQAKVWTFFYGSYINLDVLKEVELMPEQIEVARLGGFDIRIQPLANLIPSDRHCVYGILAQATHAELRRLYAHALDVLGGVYLPEAVLTETLDGKQRAALCYIAHDMEARAASEDYVMRIVEPARRLNFPSWYIDRLEAFRS